MVKKIRQYFCRHQWKRRGRALWLVETGKECAKCGKIWTRPECRGIAVSLSCRLEEFWEDLYWDRHLLGLGFLQALTAWREREKEAALARKEE